MKINFSQVYEGWKNNIMPSKELKPLIRTISRERMIICEECEFHSKNHKTMRLDAHCTNCGCTLSAKTKCLSCECPKQKWMAVLDGEQENEIKTAIKNG